MEPAIRARAERRWPRCRDGWPAVHDHRRDATAVRVPAWPGRVEPEDFHGRGKATTHQQLFPRRREPEARVPVRAAQARLDIVARQLQQDTRENGNVAITAVPLKESLVGDARPILTLFLAAWRCCCSSPAPM